MRSADVAAEPGRTKDVAQTLRWPGRVAIEGISPQLTAERGPSSERSARLSLSKPTCSATDTIIRTQICSGAQGPRKTGEERHFVFSRMIAGKGLLRLTKSEHMSSRSRRGAIRSLLGSMKVTKKAAAGQSVELELMEGRALVARARRKRTEQRAGDKTPELMMKVLNGCCPQTCLNSCACTVPARA